MHKLTKLCLKRPVSTVIIIMALILFGFGSIPSMNMQLTPDMELPMMIVYTMYPQAGPEEVERLVSRKIENVGGTIKGLESITSYSMENVSQMLFSFEYGTDMDDAYMDLQEELQTIQSELPEKASTPTVIIMDINATDSMDLSITSKSGSDVLNFVNDTLKPELDKITNVASTSVYGGNEQYISVRVNAERMNQYGLNMNTIAGFLGAANFTMPAGSVEMGSQTLNVSAEAEYNSIGDIQNIPITTGTGAVIHLSDVADVSFSAKEASSLSRYDGKDNVSVGIVKRQGSNAVELSREVTKVVNRLGEMYPDMDIITTYDSSTAIISSLRSVAETLVIGVVLSMAVLFVFFGDFKASLIVGSSMPVSLLATVIMMHASGYSLNMVTMGALVIGIGMMVDNSIVVLEMCFRKKEEGLSFEDAAYVGVKTVALSITASTLTTIVVYFPLATMKGLTGQIFGQLGFTIIFSLTASLIAAMSLIPLCFSKYKPIEKKEIPVSRIVHSVGEWYAGVLRNVLHHKKIAALVAFVIMGVSIFCFQFAHTELMPATDEGVIAVTANVRPGLGLEAKDEMMIRLEEFVGADPDVKNFSVSTSSGTASISVSAYLKKDRSRATADIANEWNKELKSFEGAEILCSSSSTSTMGMSGGASKQIDIKGSNLTDLKEAIAQIDDAIRNMPGVISTSSSFSDSAAKAKVVIDPIKAAAVGMTPAQIAQNLYLMKTGTKAMEVSINDKDYSVQVEYPSDMMTTVPEMLNTAMATPMGQSVILSDVAEIVYADSPQMITREEGFYTASLTANLDINDQYDTQDAIDEAVDHLNFPRGISRTQDMMTEMMTEEFTAIMKSIAIGIWLVFMVMAMQFESLRYAGMVMFCVPFSLIGSILLLLLSQSTLSMVSMMGFLMLSGIVVNNGILYVDTTNQYRQTMSTEDALVETGKSRLRPILMTTLTTILSMIPLAIGVGENGALMQGMAVVIVGGLIASTILTLILLPTFYMIIHKHSKAKKLKKKRKLEAAQERQQAAVEGEDVGDAGCDN